MHCRTIDHLSYYVISMLLNTVLAAAPNTDLTTNGLLVFPVQIFLRTSHISWLLLNARFSRQATSRWLTKKLSKSHFKVENVLFHEVVLAQGDDRSTERIKVRVVQGVCLTSGRVRRLQPNVTTTRRQQQQMMSAPSANMTWRHPSSCQASSARQHRLPKCQW